MNTFYVILLKTSRKLWVNMFFSSIEQARIYIKFRYPHRRNGLIVISETEIKTAYTSYEIIELTSYASEVEKYNQTLREDKP